MWKLRQGSLLSLSAEEGSPAHAGRGQQTPRGPLAGSRHPRVCREHPLRLPWKSSLPEPVFIWLLCKSQPQSSRRLAGDGVGGSGLQAPCGMTTAPEVTRCYKRKWGSIQKGGTSKHRPGREQHPGRSCLGTAGQGWLPAGHRAVREGPLPPYCPGLRVPQTGKPWRPVPNARLMLQLLLSQVVTGYVWNRITFLSQPAVPRRGLSCSPEAMRNCPGGLRSHCPCCHTLSMHSTPHKCPKPRSPLRFLLGRDSDGGMSTMARQKLVT